MLTIVNNVIYLTRGDTARIAIDTDISPGVTYTARLSVKKSESDTDYIFQKDVVDDQVLFEHADTDTLEIGRYVYDIEYHLQDASGDGQIATFGPHFFYILSDITR